MKYTLIVLGLSLNIAFTQCDNLSESQCGFNINCEWTSNIVTGNCYNLSVSECLNYDNCYVDSNPGWYDSSGPYCTGGTYQIDNGYCEDATPLECDEIDYELQCNQDSGCNWVEDINTGYCGQHNTASSCPNYPNCSWSCDGCWYLGECCGSYICTGGYYQIDNSYCEETEIIFIPGDSNGDNSLNVTDIVMIVEYILNSEYHEHSDINQDGYLNVTDIIDIVNIILENN